MDWHTLLKYDLRQLLPGYRHLPPPLPDAPADTFEAYPFAVRRLTRDPMWKGPNYVMPRQKQMDLLFVLEQVRLCTRANVPLHQGLEAAARNEIDTKGHGGIKNRHSTAAGLFLALSLSTLLFLVLTFGPITTLAVMESAFAVAATVGTFMFDAVLTRQRRAAVCGSIVYAMRHGLTLSEAMGRLGRFFPRPVVSLVEAGEASGRLSETLDQVNKDALDRYFKGQQLAGWLTYICMVAVAQLAVIGFLLFKVAPVLLEIKGEVLAGASPHGTAEPAWSVPFPLPLPSIETLGQSSSWLVGSLGALLVLAVLVGLGLVWRSLTLRFGLARWPGSALDTRIPVYRHLLALQNLGDAASMLALLLHAGTPLDRALESVAESGLHPRYAEWFGNVRARVRGGDAIGEATAEVPDGLRVPPSFHDAIAMGEYLGRLEDGLGYVAERYASELEARMTRWMSWAQVGAVLLLAYFVLSLEMGVMGTLVDLAEMLL